MGNPQGQATYIQLLELSTSRTSLIPPSGCHGILGTHFTLGSTTFNLCLCTALHRCGHRIPNYKVAGSWPPDEGGKNRDSRDG